MSSSLPRRIWLLGVAVFVIAGTASAAEIDKFLPEDTNGLISLNVRQVVDSPIFKKTYLPLLQKELKAKPEVQKQLKDLGFDPFRDVDRLLVAFAESCERTGSQAEPGVMVVLHGKFDSAKIHAKLAEIAPFAPKNLQIHKGAPGIVYELITDDRTFYFALPDKTTIVATTRKEPVIDALLRVTGKKKLQLKDKDLQELVTKTDSKQALWVTATARTTLSFETVLAGPKGNKSEQKARKTLADSGIDEISGGFWVTENLKAAFGVKVQNSLVAKAVSDALQNELGKAIDKGFDGALDDARFSPVRQFLKEMVIAGDEKYIVIQSEVPGRVFANSVK